MSECCSPSGYQDFFNQKEARRNLRRYQKKGLDKMAQRLVDYLASRGMDGRSVLEAGGGIGAIQIELLKAGAARAINVELSDGYEYAATDLLEKEGLSERADRHVGDFTELAPGLQGDDVVMHRVICCYPFMDRLMAAAMASSGRFVAATFPRDRLIARMAITLANGYSRVRRVDFRSYIHPPAEIVRTATNVGFEVAFQDQDFMWNAVVFERAA